MQKTAILKYNVLIYKEGKYFIADVPVLGISDFGKTIEEAKKNVQEAIECHIGGLIKLGEQVPPPDGDDEIFFGRAIVSVPSNIKFLY